MPARSQRIPAYRLHKPTGQAVVRLDGRDHYLGRHGTEQSREKYRRVIAEWLSGKGHAVTPGAPDPADPGPSVNALILAFLDHADAYYRRPDGTPTGELQNFVHALRPLKDLYGTTPARDFGPKSLKAVRQAMVAGGLCRNVVNQRVGKVVRVFRWGSEQELVPPGVHHGLKTLPGLRKGRTEARETEPVRPVPDAFVEAVKPHVSRQLWAMVSLQILTGMRPGEVARMRTADLDTSGRVWVYAPSRHKTEHHGKGREVFIGPRAQEVLRPWLRADLTAYLFQPREAEAERRAGQRQERKSKRTPSQRARRPKRGRRRAPGDFYNTRAYTHAIHRACRKAGVPVWGPNRLRHNAATALRKEFGLDVARAVLGHSDADTTAIYAARDRGLAVAAMERVG
jgi:integrase